MRLITGLRRARTAASNSPRSTGSSPRRSSCALAGPRSSKSAPTSPPTASSFPTTALSRCSGARRRSVSCLPRPPLPRPSLIDRETFRQVQKIKTPRGRKPKSDRLLARLDVLRCGNCGARMTVGMQKVSAKAAARGRGKLGAEYPFYRCGAVSSGDCQKGVTISAPTVEQIVSDAVRKALADIEGRASPSTKSGMRRRRSTRPRPNWTRSSGCSTRWSLRQPAGWLRRRRGGTRLRTIWTL